MARLHTIVDAALLPTTYQVGCDAMAVVKPRWNVWETLCAWWSTLRKCQAHDANTSPKTIAPLLRLVAQHGAIRTVRRKPPPPIHTHHFQQVFVSGLEENAGGWENMTMLVYRVRSRCLSCDDTPANCTESTGIRTISEGAQTAITNREADGGGDQRVQNMRLTAYAHCRIVNAMDSTFSTIRALNDPTRLGALRLLWDGREHCVCELMDTLSATQSRMSRHMAVLKQAGLVLDRRDAQWVRFRRNPDLPAPIAAIVDAVLASQRPARKRRAA